MTPREAFVDAAIALGEADRNLAIALDAAAAVPGLQREYDQAVTVFELALGDVVGSESE